MQWSRPFILLLSFFVLTCERNVPTEVTGQIVPSSWSEFTSFPPVTLQTVDFSSDDDMFIMGTDSIGTRQVYRQDHTTLHWKMIDAPPHRPDLIRTSYRHPWIAIIDTLSSVGPLLFSSTNGEAWSVPDGLPLQRMSDVAFTSKGRILASLHRPDTLEPGVVYSDDKGLTWMQAELPGILQPSRLLVFSSTLIYAIGRTSLDNALAVFKSFDGGHRWKRDPIFIFPDEFTWVERAPGDLLLGYGERRGMLQSTDYGRTWGESFVPKRRITAYHLHEGRIIIVGTATLSNVDVRMSADMGISWKILVEGLPGGQIRDVATNRKGLVYVVTDAGTMFQSLAAQIPD